MGTYGGWIPSERVMVVSGASREVLTFLFSMFLPIVGPGDDDDDDELGRKDKDDSRHLPPPNRGDPTKGTPTNPRR